jgi:hypothetical protein
VHIVAVLSDIYSPVDSCLIQTSSTPATKDTFSLSLTLRIAVQTNSFPAPIVRGAAQVAKKFSDCTAILSVKERTYCARMESRGPIAFTELASMGVDHQPPQTPCI